jgi:hypothetical protein
MHFLTPVHFKSSLDYLYYLLEYKYRVSNYLYCLGNNDKESLYMFSTNLILFLDFFCGTGIRTQGLMLLGRCSTT